jgi:hypothetical protein
MAVLFVRSTAIVAVVESVRSMQCRIDVAVQLTLRIVSIKHRFALQELLNDGRYEGELAPSLMLADDVNGVRSANHR